jgi:hypothetical protein
MRIGVCGPRNRLLSVGEAKVWIRLLRAFNPTVVCHGGSHGIDQHAGNIAKAERIPIEVTEADWEAARRDGNVKLGGPRRNRKQAPKADVWVAFVRGAGPGTRDMIEAARGAGKVVIQVEVPE